MLSPVSESVCRLKMERIHAPPVPTRVVHVTALGDRANEEPVGEPVSRPTDLGDDQSAVAMVAYSTKPFPTAAIGDRDARLAFGGLPTPVGASY